MARRPLTIIELRRRADAGRLTPADCQQVSWLRSARKIRAVTTPVGRLVRDIGDYIRAFRESRHLTIKEFADRCGLTKTQISYIELGIRERVRLDTLMKLAIGCNGQLRLSIDPLPKLRKVA